MSEQDLTKNMLNALNAHKKWKERLMQAIETGKSQFYPDAVRVDDRCDFGKFLYHEIATEQQQSAHYQRTKQLHADFHIEAARVLEIALQGQGTQANDLLKEGSAFGEASASLRAELMAWYMEALQEASSGEKSLSSERAAAILQERAKTLSKATEFVTGDSMQLVVFALAEETYGIPTEYVREVQPLREFTPVPCTPGFVVGVINIRGSIYSVIDIRSFFGVPKRELTETTKVILVNGAGLELGLMADDVKGATSILMNEINPPLAAQAAVKEEYIQGVTKDMLVVLNLDNLLRDERLVVREEVG